jgi:hypothetical protein
VEGSANTTADWIIGLDSGAANNTGFAHWNQNSGGLTPAVTNAIFDPVDPTSGPTATTGAGVIMPYFALNYRGRRAARVRLLAIVLAVMTGSPAAAAFARSAPITFSFGFMPPGMAPVFGIVMSVI